MKTIYLCGGINGLSDDEAKGWRERAKQHLSGRYEILDPMRRDFRGREKLHWREIVQGDLDDIDRSDVLLVRGDCPSWGTAMEFYHAARGGKRVVVWGTDAGTCSPWLFHFASAIFPTLDEALRHLAP